MPEITFEIWIDGETKIVVRRVSQAGHYVLFAVVLVILHEGQWVDIGRFDTAHGVPHQDVIGEKSGLVRKVWYDRLSPREVFQLAIKTFKENHEDIRTEYFRH